MTEANYQRIGLHYAVRPCLSCGGTGEVRGAPCALCWGAKTYEVGCSRPDSLPNVDVDLNHAGMTECLDCGRFVPSDEVTVKE